MNKAVPWNVNGVGFDAREAAREAARRQGKSLGEWLHGVIADHASQLGVEEAEVLGQDRVDAVTSRLERMSARASSFERRPRDDRAEDRPRSRAAARAYDEDRDEAGETSRRRVTPRDRGAESRRARHAVPMVEETDFLLEEAIDAMERRALRAERRTDDALASFAEMLEKNEARRDRERTSVNILSQKLSDIESRLGEHDQSPIKGALARLEARLDTIGRRTVAEAGVKESAKPTNSGEDKTADTSEPIRRLEEKLNAVLDAVVARPNSLESSASPIAIVASRDVPQRQRRLGDAIAEIAGRQRALDEPNAKIVDVATRFGERQVDGRPGRLSPAPQQQSFTAMQNEIATLTSKIDEIHHGVAASRQQGADLDRLNTQIASMTKTLADLASHPSRRAAEERPQQSALAFERIHGQIQEIRDLISTTAARPVDLEPIEHQIATLTERLNQQARDRVSGRDTDVAAALAAFEERFKSSLSPSDGLDVGSLEGMVRDLSGKIEAVQAPGAGAPAIEALQDQIGVLSARFERSESGLASLSGLERSMQDLFAHLEETRASVETAAAKAARDALRLAAENKTDDTLDRGRDMAALRALQNEADTRTQSTLEAVHATLDKVVDRLSLMESDIAEVRTRSKMTLAETPRPVMAPRPEPARQEPRKDHPAADRAEARPNPMALGGLDPISDPMFAHKPQDRGSATAGGPRRRLNNLDEEAGRADFIAAARRAAQAAQSDASVVAMKRPGSGSPDEARAGLAAKSRDYVASHKRPVLLSLAAIFVIIGTMAVMHRMKLDDISSEVADYRAPAKIVRTLDAPARPVKTASNTTLGEMTPDELPKSAPSLVAPIPGSDPIQTGSIASLPSFAAHGLSTPQAPPALPPGLVARADAGDAAADYELGAFYADGKAVPRDFKMAAAYYEKAADQGLPPAQYRLASLYEKGLGVAQDKLKAKNLYLKAADAGNPRAMHNLAVLLADGNGKPDYEAAATWFRKAAQFGVHDSQYNLAILLARGLGVKQSLVQSYQWFAVAADQHDTDAAAKRDEVASKLNAGDLSVAKALAASFRPRTADLAATEVHAPAGGWDGASMSSPLNSARAKISSL